MADISKLNEELKKYLGESTLGYLEQAENIREKMKMIFSENPTSTSSILDSAKRFKEIMAHQNIPLAFQSAEDYKDFITPYQSALEEKNLDALQSSLGLAMSSYLKPEYSATLQALESAKDGLAYALAHNVDGATDRLESLKNIALGTGDEERLLDAAKKFSAIASSIDSDIYKSELDRLIKNPTVCRPEIDLDASLLQATRFSEMPIFKFEDSPLGRQNQELIEHSQQQTSLLEMMATHMEKQKEHTARQITLMDLQIQKAEEQLETIKIQATSAEESANKALNWVKITLIVTVVLSIIVSTVVYFAQDYSDEKKHQELMKAINDKTVLESQLLQLQIQTANQNEFIRLMKEQNDYLKKIEIQKQSAVKQSSKMVK